MMIYTFKINIVHARSTFSPWQLQPKSLKYVRITTYQTDTKSKPNPNPNPNTTKQHALMNI